MCSHIHRTRPPLPNQTFKLALISERVRIRIARGDQVTAYADLISAVLAVVVLMLTFAPVNLHELKDAVAKEAPAEPQSQKTASLQELRERILDAATAHGVQQYVTLVYDNRGLEVSIDSVALFETGSAVLDERTVAPLMPIFSVISDASNERYVDINGHTDDTGSDDLNWRLSSERALAMLQFLPEANQQLNVLE